MDIRKLQIFEVVARLQSFSRAAEELYMAQPAVSIAVRKLEEEFGLQLLNREGRRIVLTAEGEQALLRARNILAETRELYQHMSELSGLSRGELSIACPSMLATYYLPDLLAPFLINYPGISAAVTQTGTRLIEQKILDDSVELGVITVDKLNPLLEVTPLIEEEMVVCVSETHAWAGRSKIDIAELDNAPMALYERDYYVREALEQACEAIHIKPDIRLETNFLPLISRMVKQGVGITVALSMMPEQEPGIVGVPLLPAVKFKMAIAKRKGRTLSKANQAFMTWLTEQSSR
ncbi:MAG: LysR family transcriptional regulator [Pseudomonadales bacterium]